MPPTDPAPTTYRLTPGPHAVTTACPHALTIWLERCGLSEREAVALATETLLWGWGERGRLRLERMT